MNGAGVGQREDVFAQLSMGETSWDIDAQATWSIPATFAVVGIWPHDIGVPGVLCDPNPAVESQGMIPGLGDNGAVARTDSYVHDLGGALFRPHALQCEEPSWIFISSCVGSAERCGAACEDSAERHYDHIGSWRHAAVEEHHINETTGRYERSVGLSIHCVTYDDTDFVWNFADRRSLA